MPRTNPTKGKAAEKNLSIAFGVHDAFNLRQEHAGRAAAGDDPQLKAMFETSAEVLGGLVKPFRRLAKRL
jgi:hypothetical protein